MPPLLLFGDSFRFGLLFEFYFEIVTTICSPMICCSWWRHFQSLCKDYRELKSIIQCHCSLFLEHRQPTYDSPFLALIDDELTTSGASAIHFFLMLVVRFLNPFGIKLSVAGFSTVFRTLINSDRKYPMTYSMCSCIGRHGCRCKIWRFYVKQWSN